MCDSQQKKEGISVRQQGGPVPTRHILNRTCTCHLDMGVTVHIFRWSLLEDLHSVFAWLSTSEFMKKKKKKEAERNVQPLTPFLSSAKQANYGVKRA